MDQEGHQHPEAPTVTSTSLLERIRGLDGDAWSRFVALYCPLVYDACRRYRVQPADADDIVQDVLQSVSRGIHGFKKERPGDSFRGWLYRIVQNKVRDHYRDILGAVTHVDGTARVQTISESSSETLAELLKELKRRGLPPVLLNTSLNFSGEPIVETPAEAVEFLLMRPIAGMILNDMFVWRKKSPSITSKSIFGLGVNVTAQITRSRAGLKMALKRARPAEEYQFPMEIGRALICLDGVHSLEEVCRNADTVLNERLTQILRSLEAKGFTLYQGERLDG